MVRSKRMNFIKSSLLSGVCFAASFLASAQENGGITYLKSGMIIDMAGDAPFQASVVISDGHITSIGRNLPVPNGARILDVAGKYILPGFIDMHAHVTFLPAGTLVRFDRVTSEEILKRMLAYGITTVRNPAAPAVPGVKLRDDVAHGKILGPRILTAGEPLNGKPFSTEAEIRTEVDRQAAAGVDYIKVYANCTPEETAIAIDEAHKRGLKVVGHLQNTDWPTAAAEGIDAVTHGVSWSASALPPDKRAMYLAEQKRVGAMKARIFWLEAVNVNGPEIGEVIESLKRHHISDDPTLIAYKTKFIPTEEYRSKQNVSLAPLAVQESWSDGGFTGDWTPADFARMRKVWPKMLAIIDRYYREGILLTTGSDLPNSWVVPGVSLHQEMELLSEAGIPNEAVLAMATRNPATVLGLDREIGTIEAGKRADLVILDANPLTNIRNTRTIEYVLHNGRLLRSASLLAKDRVKR